MTSKYLIIKDNWFSRFYRYLTNFKRPGDARYFVKFMNNVLKTRFKSKNIRFDFYRGSIAIFGRSTHNCNILCFGTSWPNVEYVFYEDNNRSDRSDCWYSLQHYCKLVKYYFYNNDAAKYKTNDTGILIEKHDIRFFDAVSKLGGKSLDEFKIHIDLLGY